MLCPLVRSQSPGRIGGARATKQLQASDRFPRPPRYRNHLSSLADARRRRSLKQTQMLAARSSAARTASRIARNFATVAESAGVKVAAADSASPTASVTLLVKAGSRYETAPGLAHALKNYAFKVRKLAGPNFAGKMPSGRSRG
jgi:hypothetical protein